MVRKGWTVHSKVWLAVNGEPFMGEGRMEILRAIDRNGSILGASAQTGIPYRKIWGAVRHMERCVGYALVVAQRGGAQGGGASLTEAARELMDRFHRLQAGVKETMDGRFRGLFADFLNERCAESAKRSARRGGKAS